jgi:hypothetical protein
MDNVPPDLIINLAQFLSHTSLTNIILAGKRYHHLLTLALYDRAIKYLKQSDTT